MSKLRLVYHTGKNFGDALNPILLKHYFGDLISEDGEIQLIGIGTLLGLKKEKGEKVIFSSGVSVGQEGTYGELPKIDSEYKFYCVRGPETTRVLGLNPDLAVCDGAYLLNDYYDYKSKKKDIEISYVSHHTSEKMFSGLEEIVKSCGINYISPTKDCDYCLDQISRSKLVICEAMHGAIVSDALRVPWIPAKSYKFIDSFKWNDFAKSMSIDDFSFNYLPSLHSASFFSDIIAKKTKVKFIGKMFGKFFCKKRTKEFIKGLNDLSKSKKIYLSDSKILEEKLELLKLNIEKIKSEYS